MMALGLSRARAFAALCTVVGLLGLLACDDGAPCAATEDVSGDWSGSYTEIGEMSETIDLILVDDGARITGTYAISDGTSGELGGLQSGNDIVFQVNNASGLCSGELTGSGEACGNSLTFQLECDGEDEASGTLTRTIDPCPYANDGECDVPKLCDVGTDSADCNGTTCDSRNDGICDEPEGTGRCSEASDTSDCALTCPFTNNNVCNEPEGTNQCVEGSDFNDCNFMGTCPFQNDGVCDEPQGTGRCNSGFDPIDCNPSMSFCPFQNDGVCDEPEGTFRCSEGTDFNDCFNSGGCMFQNDGVCDEPEGTFRCNEGTDFNDCQLTCNRTNDGVCDEPEGTGLCGEGTDANDCALTQIVCGTTTCTVLDPSGLGQLDACCTSTNECGVQFVTGTCSLIEQTQEGTCAPYETQLSTTPLAACCRPNGMCGLELPAFSEDACVAADVISVLAIDEVPCNQDDDAGVP
jgi:hypothetical protein